MSIYCRQSNNVKHAAEHLYYASHVTAGFFMFAQNI